MEHLGLTHQESIDLANSAIKLAFEARELYKKESLSHGESKGNLYKNLNTIILKIS